MARTEPGRRGLAFARAGPEETCPGRSPKRWTHALVRAWPETHAFARARTWKVCPGQSRDAADMPGPERGQLRHGLARDTKPAENFPLLFVFPPRQLGTAFRRVPGE